ncbi:MAG: hypothetical protein RLY16_882 [Bacteroidota bacterium]
MRLLITFILLLWMVDSKAQLTPFELSEGKETATYAQIISWYKQLDLKSPNLSMLNFGKTDAGHPLNLVLISSDKSFNPALYRQQNKVIILVNNGIHPGEPDGIDASMMLARDIVNKKVTLPQNVVIAFIPVYNIGGCLNRNSVSRVNQQGPVSYGFRGNAQNLDLNRDFTKCDSREAKEFARIFHWLQPDILMDNHVSDGADYQYTMTLLTTQYNKLGDTLGNWLRTRFEPDLYQSMQRKNWEMTPYVNFETADVEKGMEMFYDPPRYSSGYAALFQTIAFVPETHMLKPFKDRVQATYALMQTMLATAASRAKEIKEIRKLAKEKLLQQSQLPLKWQADSTVYSIIPFKGYEQAYTQSAATLLPRMYYDRNRPFNKPVKFFHQFNPTEFVAVPKYYVIQQGWHEVIDLLKLNGVQMQQLSKDSTVTVTAYRIEDYKSYTKPYEKHHKNHSVKTSSSQQTIKLLKGDYLISTQQQAKRYLVEMLEPTGDDCFFAWNYFDAILQQKEGYSDYRWEEIAANILQQQPELQLQLNEKRKTDSAFAANAAAQLDFIYKHSPHYEPVHLRYPVFRIEQ